MNLGCYQIHSQYTHTLKCLSVTCRESVDLNLRIDVHQFHTQYEQVYIYDYCCKSEAYLLIIQLYP